MNSGPSTPDRVDGPTLGPDPQECELICAHAHPPRNWTPIAAPPELNPDQLRFATLLSDARILLWTAEVRRIGDNFQWQLTVAPESLRSPLIHYTAYRRHGYLWHPAFAPDHAATEATYREAIARGAERYQQQFRIMYRGRTVWLDELVRISPLGPDAWHFSGLLREVTEHKVAEEAERRANDELHRLLQHSQCMLFHAVVAPTEDGRLSWALTFLPSALQREVFPHAASRTTSRLYDEFDVPQMPEMEARAAQAMRAGATGYQQEFVITRRADQRTFWLREYVAIMPPIDGRWTLSGVMIDVTSEKVAEFARRDADLHFQHVLEHVDCIVWHAELKPDPVEGYRWTITAPPSRLFRRLFQREPVPPVNFWTAETTPEYAMMQRTWRDALARGLGAYEQEFRYVGNGQISWLHENVTVLRRELGIVHLAGVIVDITALKGAELQLNTEKERLAVTLRAMDEAVLTVDVKGAVTFANPAAEELLQADAEDLLGAPLGSVAILHAGNPPRPTPWPLETALSADLPPDSQLFRRQAGAVLIEGCVAPLHDAASRRTGAVIVLRDVTERHMLQAHLQRAATLESVGLLAGGIAHDFNNILTALLANLSLAEMEAGNNLELTGYLREAHAATDRAAALAKQLLTFAKGGDPVLGAVNLADVIDEVTRFTLRGKPVDYTLDLASDLWPAQADRGQFAQIIQNLVLNAAQSMPQGGTIQIAARNEWVEAGDASELGPGRYVRVSVTDSGTGIAPESVNKVFTPYFTTKAGGNGLGLAVVYSIVQKHRGSIDVRSAGGRGTTFEFMLPAASIRTEGRPASSPRAPTILTGRVLVMDDEPAILRVVSSYLQQLGLHVDTATDGAQAVEAYRTAMERGARYDVVIMDLTVPGKMGGRDAIAELRTLDPSVRAIVASGYSSDPVLAHYRDFGFSAMAAKPYDISELAHKIAELLVNSDE